MWRRRGRNKPWEKAKFKVISFSHKASLVDKSMRHAYLQLLDPQLFASRPLSRCAAQLQANRRAIEADAELPAFFGQYRYAQFPSI